MDAGTLFTLFCVQKGQIKAAPPFPGVTLHTQAKHHVMVYPVLVWHISAEVTFYHQVRQHPSGGQTFLRFHHFPAEVTDPLLSGISAAVWRVAFCFITTRLEMYSHFFYSFSQVSEGPQSMGEEDFFISFCLHLSKKAFVNKLVRIAVIYGF